MDVASKHGHGWRTVLPGRNWSVTAIAPPAAELSAVIRSGFAQEMARKVKALPCPHACGATCSDCVTLADVLDILREYQ